MNDEFEFIVNESRRPLEKYEPCGGAPFSFHRGLPGYRPGPLVCSREAERSLGVRRVWVKDESERFGLPSFKCVYFVYIIKEVVFPFFDI